MFPTKSTDPYIEKNGTRSTLGNKIGSGGGSILPEHSESDAGKVLTVGEDGDLEWDQPAPSVNYMTQLQWNALTFAQKKAAGFTAIGTDSDAVGTYYNYNDLSSRWRTNPTTDNVVDISLNGSFDFHGFISDTIGDKLDSSGRGGLTATTGPVFACNMLSTTNYGGVIVFGLTSEAVTLSEPSFYGEYTIVNGTLKCGTISGWSGNKNVRLTHNGVEQNLATIYAENSDVYTIKQCLVESGNKITIPNDYLNLLPIIEDILRNY